MTRRHLILFATGGSAALILGALAFQYIGDLPPCKLCYWQRYPHFAAIGIGVVALVTGMAALAALGALAALSTAGVGLYHVGVEQKWWQGPTSCSGGGNVGALSTEDLLNQIMSAPLVRCDEIPWQMLGLSMAGWNMVLSLGLAVIWVMAVRRA